MSDTRAVIAELRALHLGGTADLIESQAKELAEAQARVVLLRGVLDELVYLKDMKDHLEKLHAMGHGTDYDYYHKNKPRAWAEAREAIASPDTANIVQKVREKYYEECATICEGRAGSAYVTAINRVMHDDKTKGWEAKVKSGKFGVEEHKAHKEINEGFGGHLHLMEAANAIRAAIGEKK